MSINELVGRNNGKPALPLWDFSIANDITNEVFPAAGDVETKMKYYYESIHFNQHTGSLVLDRIEGQVNEETPDDFGVPLTSKTLTNINTQLREGLELFRSQSPGIVEELNKALPQR